MSPLAADFTVVFGAGIIFGYGLCMIVLIVGTVHRRAAAEVKALRAARERNPSLEKA